MEAIHSYDRPPTADVTVNAAPRYIAVVGGGITGLAAAHRLLELSPQMRHHAARNSAALGRCLWTTERQDGYLLERSADNFITNVPWG